MAHGSSCHTEDDLDCQSNSGSIRLPIQFIRVLDPLTASSSASKSLVRTHVALDRHAKARLHRTIDYQKKDGQRAKGMNSLEKSTPLQSGRSNPMFNGQRSSDLMEKLQAPDTSTIAPSSKDPFQSYAVNLTTSEHYLLDHFVKFVIPQTANRYPRLDGEPVYDQNMKSYWLPFAITDVGLMNGVFLIASRSLAVLYSNETFILQALKYKGVCIRSINVAISQEGIMISDSTIAKALVLASDEFLFGDKHAVQKHNKGIKDMVTTRGGLDTLGLHGFLQHLVLWNDRTTAFYLGEVGNFKHLNTFHKTASTDSISPGFRHEMNPCWFSEDIISILDDLCSYTNAYVSQSPLPNVINQAYISSLNDFNIRLILLTSNYRCLKSSRTYSSIEICLAPSIMMFVSLLASDPNSPLLEKKHLASTIESQLREITQSSFWTHHIEIIVWMAFMAYIAFNPRAMRLGLSVIFEQLQVEQPSRWEDVHKSQSMHDISTTRTYQEWSICNILLNCLRELNIYSVDDIRSLLRRFLWIERTI